MHQGKSPLVDHVRRGGLLGAPSRGILACPGGFSLTVAWMELAGCGRGARPPGVLPPWRLNVAGSTHNREERGLYLVLVDEHQVALLQLLSSSCRQDLGLLDR